MQSVQCVLRTFGVLTVCGLAFGCAGADGSQPNENAAQISEADFNPQVVGYWQNNPSSYVSSDAGPFTLPVCMSLMPDGTYQCGKLYQSQCRVNWGGKALYNSAFQYLYNDNRYSWADAVNGVPPQAVIGDKYGALPNQPSTHVYVCEAYEAYDNLWHPGKWWSGGCAIEWQGKAQTNFTYGHANVVRILIHP